ncbi:MAG: CapA family protein [Firmicutes bacterium]|nr:CapA family protein [Bacillota bacterium]
MFLSIIITLSAASCVITNRFDAPVTDRINAPRNDETDSPVSPDTPVTEPHDPVITKISFLGAGDNIVYYGNVRDAQSKAVSGGRKYNFLPTYYDIADLISQADISFINQETLMSGGEFSYYPRFNGPQDMGYDLVELGFDIVNIANNHMLDHSASGLSKTIDFWKTLDVMLIGGYYNSDDFSNIRVYEKSGIKIAFLSYTYGTNGLTKPASSPLYIPYINEEDITVQTKKAKELADLVFVSVHWGEENSFKPSSEQIKYANLMADLGVDVIIGHHPHVIQPVEWLTGKDGNKTLCIYSLGNLMAEMARDYNMVGGIISFDIVRTDDEKPVIENVLFTPTMFHFPGNFYNNHIYLLEDYTSELAAQHGVKTYYKNSISYDQLIKYVKNTISPEFLPEFYK